RLGVAVTAVVVVRRGVGPRAAGAALRAVGHVGDTAQVHALALLVALPISVVAARVEGHRAVLGHRGGVGHGGGGVVDLGDGDAHGGSGGLGVGGAVGGAVVADGVAEGGRAVVVGRRGVGDLPAAERHRAVR